MPKKKRKTTKLKGIEWARVSFALAVGDKISLRHGRKIKQYEITAIATRK